MSKWTKLDAGAAEYRKLEAEAKAQTELTATRPELIDARLRELEAVIKSGLSTFMSVGAALLEIRDNRLYKPNYSTFESYCLERWNLSRSYAHRTIEATKVASNLLTTGNIQPHHESQVRPLTGLPKKAQRRAWEKAVQSAEGKQPTAKQVEGARERVEPKRKRRPEPPAYEPTEKEQAVLDKFEATLKQASQIATTPFDGEPIAHLILKMDTKEKRRWIEILVGVLEHLSKLHKLIRKFTPHE